MSVNDLIAQGLFMNNLNQCGKKFVKVEDLPKEIKNYKLTQYEAYKKLGENKAEYLRQMLIRIAFIREWHDYENHTINRTIFHLSVQENYKVIFQVIVILLWADMVFCENGVSEISEKINQFVVHGDISKYQNYIGFLSRSLISGVDLQPYEKNGKNKEQIKLLKEELNQPAIKVKTIEEVKQLPISNILIGLNPLSDTKILMDSIRKIIHHEKQRLEKNAKNRNKNQLFDKEYNTFIEYNLLFYMDIYLYTQVFGLAFSNELWAKIVYNRKNLGSGDLRKNLIDNCRKYLDKFQKDISSIDYIYMLQHKLGTEIRLVYIKATD